MSSHLCVRWGRLLFSSLLLLTTLLLVSGCATPPPQDDPEALAEFEAINDPLEPFNRGVFEFNQGFDALFLKPLAEFYLLLLPPPVQTAVHNVINNLQSPVIFFNDLLQLEGTRALNTPADL
ncbi:MAG: VacJ family lipoprotein [Rhodospirillales bacterium]|nr:VacJ family lipoprotein [Rhodospirillales bacterium]